MTNQKPENETSIIDRIKTFEDALKEADPEVISDCAIFPTDTVDVVAYKKLKLITAVINEGVVLDWKKINQRKWIPYFDMSSGFGFGDSHYYYDCTNSDVGSRLCFSTREKSDYTATQFLDIYKDYFIKNK
jgi:hypothetical protein